MFYSEICQKVQLRQLPKFKLGSNDLFKHQSSASFEIAVPTQLYISTSFEKGSIYCTRFENFQIFTCKIVVLTYYYSGSLNRVNSNRVISQ